MTLGTESGREGVSAGDTDVGDVDVTNTAVIVSSLRADTACAYGTRWDTGGIAVTGVGFTLDFTWAGPLLGGVGPRAVFTGGPEPALLVCGAGVRALLS